MNKRVSRATGSLSQSKDEQELSHLMRLTQSGDSGAYNQLLTRIEKMLQSYVRKSVRDDMAEDVIQEIILGIHAKRNTFNTEQFFLPWLYAIARYKVIDYIRAKGKREVLLIDPEDSESLLASDILLASDFFGVVDSFTVDDLESLFVDLPEKQREVIKSVKIDGLSIKETSTKLNLTESDIKISIHRALKTLKARYGSPR
jgi:RNA polymerase sigma-70 factor (ECF subfamily)